MESGWAIKVDRVSKQYRLYPSPWHRVKHEWLHLPTSSHEDVWALQDVSLQVEARESIAILGVNGSGKSTLLKIISGVTTPSAGEVAVRGSVAPILELGTGFVPELTGRENAFFSAYVHGFTQAQMAERMPSVEEFAEIGSYIDQPVKSYSSGMYSRLAIAVAFHLSADILIIDEALAVGDVFFRQKCFDYLNGALKDRTKLFVTHNLELVSAFADRVLVLDRGRAIYFGDKLEGIRKFQSLRAHGHIATDELAAEKARRQNLARDIATFDHAAAIDVDPAKLIGAGEVVFEKVTVDVDSERGQTVRKGARVGIDILLRCNQPVTQRLVFGYGIRDSNSLNIMASDSELSGLELPHLQAGTYVARLEFDWPDVRPGAYTLTLAVVEIDATGARRQQCRASDFLALQAVKTNPVYGVLHNPLTYFDIGRIAAADAPASDNLTLLLARAEQ